MNTLRDKISHSRQTFAGEGESFVTTTRTAGRAFVEQTQQAGRALAASLAAEGASWGDYALQRRDEARDVVREALTPSGFQRGVLASLVKLLESLQTRVAKRLAVVEEQPDLGIVDYDTLTAKVIIAQIDDLTAAQCRAVFELEQANKQSATVLRALEPRLAA